MRTRNALERLAAAAPAVELPVDAGEEDRILERILASGRATRRRRARPPVLLFVGALGAAVVAFAAVELGHGNPPAPRASGGHHVALSGSKIELAGYHFRTPAGFEQSASSCLSAPVPGEPRPAIDGFAAAASAEGGCVEDTFLSPERPNPSAAVATPAGQPVDVGSYQGYYVAQGSSGDALYVALPDAGGGQPTVYLVLFAQGLTENQLIAVAASGLATLPLSPTQTTGTETGG